jgi:hypothetical protein
MKETKTFISLYEYRNHKDTDGVGKQLSEFANIMESPRSFKIIPHSKYKEGRIEIYPKETIDKFFKIKEIFNGN